ncbi:MAG: hypothetical protein AMS18_00400 [Gemmatimonas sp. SG8_17]|nr:MAG: hypothetical protein AMS18_00400 [Gemmatimonas sp. SG8_17]
MDRRAAQELDNYITGHGGEDQFRIYEWDDEDMIYHQFRSDVEEVYRTLNLLYSNTQVNQCDVIEELTNIKQEIIEMIAVIRGGSPCKEDT